MRVLHVIPSVAARYGGPSSVVLKMTAELRIRGLDVILATTDADGPGRLPVELGELREYEEVPAIFFRRQFSETFKYSRPLSRWLSQHVKSFDCVHIHAVFSHSSLVAARACLREAIPYIVRPLGSLESWSLSQKPMRKRMALALGARRMLTGAAAIHYTTQREREESEEMLGLSNGIVIPLGVDAYASPGPPGPPSPASGEGRGQIPSPQGGEGWRVERRGEARTILFLARLHPKKGIELLLEAFAGLTNADHRLVIAGSGQPAYEQKLHQLAESLGVAERVDFVGWLDGEAKALAFVKADLFVLPSIQENFGLAVLEAMAAGLPVAVSREVDLAEEVAASDAGWIFERTVEGLSAVLNESLSDEDELHRRGDNGRDAVERKFLWPVIAGKLEGLYRRTCGG